MQSRLASLLCLGLAIPMAIGSSPIILALAAKSSASAFSKPYDNPCTKDWTGPSDANSMECAGITEWALDNQLWQYGIPFAIGFLLCCPGCCIILCGRYCCGCFGSSKQRPGHVCCGGTDLDILPEGEKARMYSQSCIYVAKIFAVLVGLVGVAGLILNIVGGIKIANGMTEVSDAVTELVAWFLQIIGEAQTALKDSNGNYPDGFDLEMFDDVAEAVQDAKQSYFTDGIDAYRTPILLGSLIPAFITVLPTALILLPCLAAICNIRKCIPISVSVIAFPVQFIYFFVVTLLLVVLVPVDILCNDIEAEPNEKSIMQWYIVPYCDSESPFKSIIENVNAMEHENSVEGCEKLLEFCSTTPAWSFTSPDLVFYCNLTNATECRTLEDIVAKVDGMIVKVGAPETCGGNASGCTLRQCATSCDNSNARSSAADAVDALNTAQRVLRAFETILLPWLDCGRLINKLLGLGPRQMCSTMRGGLTYFKDGSILIAAGCVVAVIAAFLGEKRFFDREKLIKEEDEYLEAHKRNEINVGYVVMTAEQPQNQAAVTFDYNPADTSNMMAYPPAYASDPSASPEAVAAEKNKEVAYPGDIDSPKKVPEEGIATSIEYTVYPVPEPEDVNPYMPSTDAPPTATDSNPFTPTNDAQQSEMREVSPANNEVDQSDVVNVPEAAHPAYTGDEEMRDV